MAFVCQSKRIFHQYNNSTKNIGPGQYQTIDLKQLNKTTNARAPFNSSNIKRSIYDKKQIMQNASSQITGPGYYDFNYSFVQNNVKLYTNNHSVIVKINPLESKSFKSNVPRFKSLQTDNPGPGQYNQNVRSSTFMYDIKKQSIQKRKELKQKINFFLKDLKQQNKISSKPSIPSKTFKLQKKSSNPLNEENQNYSSLQRTKEKQQPEQSNKKNNKGFTWAKSQRKFLSDIKKNASDRGLGPGKYFKKTDNNQNQNIQNLVRGNKRIISRRAKTQSSNFKTKYPSTFFDQICYQTYSKQTAAKRNQENYKTAKPGPGFYQIDGGLCKKIQKNKNNIAYQFFGSTVERFPIQNKQPIIQNYLFPFKQKQPSNLNLAFYNSIGQDKSFNKRQHSFLTNIDRKINVFDKDDYIPGPGEYEVQKLKQVFKPKKGKVIQNFGFSKQRFLSQNFEQKDDSIEEQIVQSSIPKRKKKEIQSFMFKSKIPKDSYQIKTQQSQTFGKYDVTQTDVGSKLKKQLIFLQNLKKIQVSIPAFDSGIARFQYQKQKKSKSQNKQCGEQLGKQNDKKSLFLNTKTDKMRQKMIEKNKQQITKSKKSTMYNDNMKKGRFQDSYIEQYKLKNPGVGHYSLRSNWAKQTYNIKYHKSYIMSELSQYKNFPRQMILQNDQFEG